jgi:hypothetical protein
MTASFQPESKSASRRALLAGALGGIGAWAACAIGRVAPAEAAAGDPIRMGRLNKAGGTSTELQTKTSQAAFKAVQLGGGAALRGEATSGRGVMGVAGPDGTGVYAYSPDHYGVFARTADAGVGVFGTAGISDPSGRGVMGSSEVGTGVWGETVSGTAVKGRIISEGGGYGVWGQVSGEPSYYEAAAVYGSAVGFSWAGRFDGEVQISKNLQFLPTTAPPDSSDVTGARLFVRENISGKGELCVQFETGAVQVLATEPAGSEVET